MTGRATRVTIRDVALRASVSTATVSRVLAGVGSPRPATAAAVKSAADELGYRPSGVARSLRMQRTRTLGLIVTDIANPFFPELVKAADDRARELGYSILLGTAAYDERQTMRYLNLMADHRVDGMIVASSQLSDEGWNWLSASPVPVVVANAEPHGLLRDGRSRATTSARAASPSSTWSGLGTGGSATSAGPSVSPRPSPVLEGFRAACADAGLDPSDTPVIDGEGDVDEWRPSGGRDARAPPGRDGDLLLQRPDGHRRASSAPGQPGRRVPDDISVVGLDDIAAASWTAPSLTTVAQRKADMGRLAVESIVDALEDADGVLVPSVVRLSATLCARESTARVRSAQDEARDGPDRECPVLLGRDRRDRRGAARDTATVIDEMAETGYAGTELGDWGFMPTDPARLRDELGSRGLALVGSWVSVKLQDRTHHETSAADAVRTARAAPAIVGGPDSVVVLGNDPVTATRCGRRTRVESRPICRCPTSSGTSSRPGRTRSPGECWTRRGFARSSTSTSGRSSRPATRRAGSSRARTPLFSGCVSTLATGRSARARIRWQRSPSLPRGSGTSISRTATPLSFGPRARTTGMGRPRSGMACSVELGTGDVDFPGVLSALDRPGLRRVDAVVEQDVLPGMGTPRESARRNREYLRSIGA